MSKIYMMIGIMGSGKSYEAKLINKSTGAAIVSSDVVRANLYKDVPYAKQDQSEVFSVVNTMILGHIVLGEDVIYDATNTSRKQRKHFISTIGKGHEVIGVFVCPPIETIIMRGLNRNGTPEYVPMEKVMRVLQNFHVPLLEEGFSSMEYRGQAEDSVYAYYPEDYDQNNPYHNLSLKDHASRVWNNASSGEIYKDVEGGNAILYYATYMHDIGKPLTRSFKSPDHCSYIGHDNVSAYIFASVSKANKNHKLLNLALLLISFHIQVRYTKEQKLKKFVGVDNYALLLKLEDCDTRGKDLPE